MRYDTEKRVMERVFYSLLRKKTRIKEAAGNALGYTSKGGDIYIGFRHPLVSMLKRDMQVVMRRGVFAHEMLHQFFTDFEAGEKILDSLSSDAEKTVFQTLSNLIEDTAIEYFAPTAFGGSLLDSLRFSIRHIYAEDPGLGADPTAFAELIHALIMFGDLGIVKGKFRFPEAIDAFGQIAPSYNTMVKEPSSKKRMKAAVEWMELLRPLWEQELEEVGEEAFFEGIPQKSVSPECKDGKPVFTEEDLEDAETDEGEAAKARAALAKKLEEATSEGAKAPMDEAIEEAIEEAAKEANDESEGKTPEEKEAKESEKEDAKLAKSLKEEMEKQAKQDEERERAKLEENDPSLPVEEFANVPCEHRWMDPDPCYDEVKAPLNEKIKLLSGHLKRIFSQDMDQTIRATSGRYNIRRAAPQTTVKIFDKKKERRDVDDLAVFLLIDESGSMSGNRAKQARASAILLAESLFALKIPVYVCGFTADVRENGCANHRHYVPWKANRSHLSSMRGIDAVSNNDDAYSIAYATEQLKRRKEAHKILFVISDGQPAAHRIYGYGRRAVDETAAMVKKAKKVASVVAISIQTDEEVTKEIYGAESCIIIHDTEELSGQLVQQLKRVVKNY